MVTHNEGHNLRIYISGIAYPNHYINCWCKRWDESDYDIVIETFLPSAARGCLFRHTLPGAIREYDNPLGWVINLDETYSRSSNTLILGTSPGLPYIIFFSISNVFLLKINFKGKAAENS